MKRLVLFCLFICLGISGCCKSNNVDVIRFSTWGSASEMSVLKPIVEDFERDNPNIKVQILHIPQDYFKKLHLLFASRTEPDVVLINNHNIPVYKNFLLSLNSYVNVSDYYKNSIESLSSEDDLYAVPRDYSALVVYYNKSLFKSSGVPYPTSDWTLADFLNVARRMTNNYHFGVSYEPLVYYALPFIHYYGGGVYKKIDDKIVFSGDSKESVEGVQFYKDLAYKYHYAPQPSEVGSKTLAQMFLEQKIAMHISGRWLVPKYSSSAKFDWGVVNFPKYMASGDATGWAVSKNTKHKESAIKFVMYLSREDNIVKISRSGLIVPARKNICSSNDDLQKGFSTDSVFIKVGECSPITVVDKKYNSEVERLNEVYFNNGK